MKCPKCDAEMIIDEWGGWIWTCFHCDYTGREATDLEIEELEKDIKESDIPY